MKKFIKGVRFAPKNYSDEVEAKIQHYKKEGYKLPSRHLLRTEEQLAGIRESAKINTALLDYISANIREGMSTAEIDHMVYEFTTDHDALYLDVPRHGHGFPVGAGRRGRRGLLRRRSHADLLPVGESQPERLLRALRHGALSRQPAASHAYSGRSDR